MVAACRHPTQGGEKGPGGLYYLSETRRTFVLGRGWFVFRLQASGDFRRGPQHSLLWPLRRGAALLYGACRTSLLYFVSVEGLLSFWRVRSAGLPVPVSECQCPSPEGELSKRQNSERGRAREGLGVTLEGSGFGGQPRGETASDCPGKAGNGHRKGRRKDLRKGRRS